MRRIIVEENEGNSGNVAAYFEGGDYTFKVIRATPLAAIKRLLELEKKGEYKIEWDLCGSNGFKSKVKRWNFKALCVEAGSEGHKAGLRWLVIGYHDDSCQEVVYCHVRKWEDVVSFTNGIINEYYGQEIG